MSWNHQPEKEWSFLVSPEAFQPPSFSQESMEVDEFHESGHLLIRRQWCQAWLKMPWCHIKSHPFKLFWEGRSHHCWDIPMWFDVLEVDGMECRVDIWCFSYQDHVQSEDSKLFFIGSFPLASSLVISWSMWKTVTSTRRGNCYGQFRRKGEHTHQSGIHYGGWLLEKKTRQKTDELMNLHVTS